MLRFAITLSALALLGCKTETPGPDGNGNGDENTDGDCMTDAEEQDAGTDPTAADSDGDSLDDCDEIDLGTDPMAEDSDGDGVLDPEEVDCSSDPMDAGDACYACGWEHGDPGNLQSTGSAEGDVIANLELTDQCGEQVDLWDFAGEYHILFMTAAW